MLQDSVYGKMTEDVIKRDLTHVGKLNRSYSETNLLEIIGEIDENQDNSSGCTAYGLPEEYPQHHRSREQA